jgi:hypothetical protein
MEHLGFRRALGGVSHLGRPMTRNSKKKMQKTHRTVFVVWAFIALGIFATVATIAVLHYGMGFDRSN